MPTDTRRRRWLRRQRRETLRAQFQLKLEEAQQQRQPLTPDELDAMHRRVHAQVKAIVNDPDEEWADDVLTVLTECMKQLLAEARGKRGQ